MKLAATAALAVLWLAGCADEGPSPPATRPVATVSAAPATAVLPPRPPSLAFPVAGAMPAERAAAASTALSDALARRLAGAPVMVDRAADGAPRLRFDAEISFEAGSAQLRAEALLPVATAAEVLRDGGAYVVQVIAGGVDAAAVALAERRAESVAAVLVGQGLAASRVRFSARRADGPARIDLIYEAIVEGRELHAWMAPAEAAR